MLYVGKVARTYRLDEGLVSRLESRAAELGQSHTTFVSRALEKALSGVPSVDPLPVKEAPASGAPSRPASPRAPEPQEKVAPVDPALKDPPGDLPKIAKRHWA